jgi:hypothetical protein
VKLHGARELRARFKALRQVFKPLGRDWADRTVAQARGRVRVSSGKTRGSIRRKHATQRKAAVTASYGARFLDKGTVPHQLRAKRFAAMSFAHSKTGQPVFTRRVKHPGGRPFPFLRVSAREQLHSDNNIDHVIRAWNRAAPGISAPGLGAGTSGGLGL